MYLKMYGATDKGLVRKNNQDAFFCDANYGVAIVSDGMGGHKGGEIASALTVDGLKSAFLATSEIRIDLVGAFLDEVLQRINSQIMEKSRQNENLRGMGATVNYLQFAGNQVAIGHAGDSRTYLIRPFIHEKGKKTYAFWQLTIDHNVQTFVERKIIIPKHELTPRELSRLTSGMGVADNLKSDLYDKTLENGDVFLTCSDGLHGYCEDKDIIKALVLGPLKEAPRRLVELAYRNGAPDNVTVVISSFSSVNEPLLEENMTLKGTHFLVRFPEGHLKGPWPVSKVIHAWLERDIPSTAEVSSGTGPWIFLENLEKLFYTYPEFRQPKVQQNLHVFRPDSIYEQEKSHSQKKSYFDLKKIIFMVLAFLIILFILQLYVSYQNLLESAL